MMASQEKTPSTLIKYMGIKDADVQEPNHDEQCLKLLNEKLVEKIIWEKILKEKPSISELKNRFTIFKYEDKDFKKILYKFGQEYPDTRTHEKYLSRLDNMQVWRSKKIEINKLEIGHVVVKRGYNGFSQRLGFVDIFCSYSVVIDYFIKIDGKRFDIDNKFEDGILFFKVKTTNPSVGLVAREIEFFRDALTEIENKELDRKKIIPLFIAKEKLPVSQFDTITFDEILKMERELK